MDNMTEQNTQSTPDTIRESIEQTRARLDEKLGALQSEVKDTVQDVKGQLQKFNLAKHIEERPWACVGAAVGIGFLLSQLGGGDDYERVRRRRSGSMVPSALTMLATGAVASMKTAAMGQLMGFIKEVVQDAVPQEYKQNVNGLFNKVNGQLGIQPT